MSRLNLGRCRDHCGFGFQVCLNCIVVFFLADGPVLHQWAKAFDGHLPLGPDTITADKAVQRVGYNTNVYEYIFVVNGITLGVADSKGAAAVDYLNAPKQTRELAKVPDGSQAPSATLPLTKQDIIAMLEADGGTRFPESEIRLIPSGLSGSLNGGMYAEVGGDPRVLSKRLERAVDRVARELGLDE